MTYICEHDAINYDAKNEKKKAKQNIEIENISSVFEALFASQYNHNHIV